MIQAESNSCARPAPPRRAFSCEVGMDAVIAWAVPVKLNERAFARHFTRRGVGCRATADLGYAAHRSQSSRMLARAEILVTCFEEVELLRRSGAPLLPAVRRKLIGQVERARRRG